jgi:hypothetical protein
MMRTAKTIAKERALTAADEAGYRLLGLTIIALVPALFWTGVVAAVGTAIGQPPSAITLMTVGAAIATFLLTAAMTLFARLDWQGRPD